MGKTYRGEERERFRKNSKDARKLREARKNQRSLGRFDNEESGDYDARNKSETR